MFCILQGSTSVYWMYSFSIVSQLYILGLFLVLMIEVLIIIVVKIFKCKIQVFPFKKLERESKHGTHSPHLGHILQTSTHSRKALSLFSFRYLASNFRFLNLRSSSNWLYKCSPFKMYLVEGTLATAMVTPLSFTDCPSVFYIPIFIIYRRG